MVGGVRSLEPNEGGMETGENQAGIPMMSGSPANMGPMGNQMPENFAQGDAGKLNIRLFAF